MLSPGVWPAAVTPFQSNGEVDNLSLAKLLAYYRAAGCTGAVLAGTNGEGPSLSAIEKRDLIRKGIELAEGLPLVLGIATPSLHEATWLASQAGKAGAAGVLLMAPSYFRNAPENGIVEWIEKVADAATCPVIVYNFPKFTGFTFTALTVEFLAKHPNIAGFKDSSGELVNLSSYREAVPPEKLLFVGDETLLHSALKRGWSGTISGASNLLAPFLVQIVKSWVDRDHDQADAKFDLLLPAIEAVRKSPQPASNKAVLSHWGILENGEPRLPLRPVDPEPLAEKLREILGIHAENLGISKP